MDAVALRKESVDRNYGSDLTYSDGVVVALRKESVDRNAFAAWKRALQENVALRKESVDRNYIIKITDNRPAGRSPQGERG